MLWIPGLNRLGSLTGSKEKPFNNRKPEVKTFSWRWSTGMVKFHSKVTGPGRVLGWTVNPLTPGVEVEVWVGDGVEVAVEVKVGVRVGVRVQVSEGVQVTEGVKVPVGVFVGVEVIVGDQVEVPVDVGVGETVAVAVGVKAAVADRTDGTAVGRES